MFLFSRLHRWRARFKFDVEASVAIEGTFSKWDATIIFTSADVATGVMEIKIPGSESAGSGGFQAVVRAAGDAVHLISYEMSAWRHLFLSCGRLSQ
jgi:hypothetical protein